MDKIEVFGRVLSQEEIEHVFLKAKKLQEDSKTLELMNSTIIQNIVISKFGIK